MSVEPMTMVTLSGPQSMVDTALQTLVANRQFHMENAVSALEKTRRLIPFDTSNPYTDMLAKAKLIMDKAGLKPEYRDFTLMDYLADEVSEYLDWLEKKLSDIADERDRLESEARSDAVLAEQLKHFSNFDIELKSLFELRYAKFRFGRLPTDDYDRIMREINQRGDVYYFASGRTEHWIYGGYCTLPHEASRVDGLFSSAGFERIHFDIVQGEDAESTVQETMARIASEAESSKLRREELDRELTAVVAEEKDKLFKIWSWLRFVGQSRELRANVGERHGKFYIVGWVPKVLSKAYAQECESYEDFSCILSEPKDKKEMSPPVKFKKGLLSSIYEPFVDMYGLPAYGEVDPRLFMALTYTLIFGVMFGDVGQGACLFAVGLLLWLTKKIWLARIISLCGITSTIMGFVYGSVFGNEEILGGFKVLDSANTMTVLIAAVAIGVVLLLVSMILNIITGIRQRDVKKIFFEPNGLAGFVLYGGVAFAAVELAMFGNNFLTAPYIICVIVVPLLLILGATPLTKLINGEKDWMPKSIGMFFVEGFFELFETMLSYVSNTISFLRIGAYAISHAGMMMVVYMLTNGGESILGLVFGNIFITGLEAALVCIQIMRLEFYELFGRFYKGGGRRFTPVKIDYQTAA